MARDSRESEQCHWEKLLVSVGEGLGQKNLFRMISNVDKIPLRYTKADKSSSSAAFRYMTPKLRLDHEALDDHLLRSKTFHIISSPSRCIDLVSNITQMRRALGGPYSEPIFIWEPVPDLCVPDELAACYEALKHVQVVSPNHAELCGFFDVEASDEDGSAGESIKDKHKIGTKCWKNVSDLQQ